MRARACVWESDDCCQACTQPIWPPAEWSPEGCQGIKDLKHDKDKMKTTKTNDKWQIPLPSFQLTWNLPFSSYDLASIALSTIPNARNIMYITSSLKKQHKHNENKANMGKKGKEIHPRIWQPDPKRIKTYSTKITRINLPLNTRFIPHTHSSKRWILARPAPITNRPFGAEKREKWRKKGRKARHTRSPQSNMAVTVSRLGFSPRRYAQ